MTVPTAIRRASLEKDDAQADLTAISGKADTIGDEVLISSNDECLDLPRP
jgi:hypothetical protein